MPLTQSAIGSRIDPQEMVAKLSELVGINSVVEDGHTERQVVDAVVGWCRQDDVPFRLIEVSPGRPNLLIEWEGSSPGPTLLFEAHSDTVTAGNLSHWTRPAFELTQEGDRLYGRGTADTKGNLVAAYLALRELVRETHQQYAGRLQFLVPIDEEGMMTGIRHYIASGEAEGVDGAICCEPEDAQVCIRQKGGLRLRVEIRGAMAHGAMPLTGNNPLPIMAQFLQAMMDEEKSEQERVGFDPLLGWPSITPTEVWAPLNGVSGFNVVPDSVAVSLDIRTVVGQSHADIQARIQGRLDQVIADANYSLKEGRVKELRARLEEVIDVGEFQGTLIVVDDRPMTNTPLDNRLVRAVAAAVQERMDAPAIFSGVPGATDGTWLWQYGIPIVTTGAGNRYVPHHADEWVSLKQLCDVAVIYADAAYRFLNGGYSLGSEGE